MKSLQANLNRILLKLVIADDIDMIVFNMINKMHSVLVLRATLFVTALSPKHYTFTAGIVVLL